MTMVANNYLDEGRPHKEVIEMMALGFTGKLQQWWNNCLTEVSKEDGAISCQESFGCNKIFKGWLKIFFLLKLMQIYL